MIPLAVTGISGQTASIFKAILNTTDAFVINNAGNISTGTWNASTIGASYGGTGQTTYTDGQLLICLLYTSPSPRDRQKSRMPSSA